MSHQRYLSHDPIKEPHSVSVKVLRLSCPSLVSQYPVEPPFQGPGTQPAPLPGSLAYRPYNSGSSSAAAPVPLTNPSPFLLSPILNLPVSFGSAYVGETFSCTLCANNDLPTGGDDDDDDNNNNNNNNNLEGGGATTTKKIRDVRIEAEMKTPGLGKAQRLELSPATPAAGEHRGGGDDDKDGDGDAKPSGSSSSAASGGGADLAPGGTLQKVVSFDLKEEGNHVLAVTVSYYEATETSGRTRTFRKLYQFICKPSLIVRTKVGVLEEPSPASSLSRSKGRQHKAGPLRPLRRWVLEAQLENCSDDTMQLDRVVVEPEPGLTYRDCNSWVVTGGASSVSSSSAAAAAQKPVLRPGEVEQVCFVVEALSRAAQVARGVDEEDAVDVVARAEAAGAGAGPDARVVFGVLGIGWRGEMGSRGYLSTGKLGTRVVR